MSRKTAVLAASAASLVLGAGLAGCTDRASAAPAKETAQTPAAAPPVLAPPAPAADRQVAPLPSLAPLVKQLRPAVVNVYTTQNVRRGARGRYHQSEEFQEFFERFFRDDGAPREQQRNSLGSGFLIGDGYALTNNHVIEGADGIRLKLNDGRELDAKVVGRDPSTDVALLKLDGDGAKDLPSVRLGDSDGLEVGDYVVAIGNPFGLSHTVTSGIVSAKERIIGAGPYDEFIQTDASINPGNSGGPLFNLKGEVVGINTAIIARGQGIGFAVPANLVKDLLPQLRDSGRVARGWLGVGIQEITPELAKTFGLAQPKGALISQVFPNGPASKAGLQGGDVVVELNGRGIDSPGALSRSVALIQPGGTAKVKLLRDGKEKTLELKVGERDEARLAAGELPAGEGEAEAEGASLGLRVAPLTPEAARRASVEAGSGLLVEAVQSDSAAEAAGVQAGDVLLEVQRRATATLDAYRKVAREVRPGETVLFRVRRGGSALYLAARAPTK